MQAVLTLFVISKSWKELKSSILKAVSSLDDDKEPGKAC